MLQRRRKIGMPLAPDKGHIFNFTEIKALRGAR